MGKFTYKGFRKSVEGAPSPISIVTGANLKTSTKEPSPKPKGAAPQVADKASKAPFPRETRFAETLTAEALEVGLVLWPNVGFTAEGEGDLVIVGPPFIVAEEEIGEIVTRLKTALETTLKKVK